MKVAVTLPLLPRVVFSLKPAGHNSVANSREASLVRGGVLDLFAGLKRGEHSISFDSIRVN